MLPSIYSYTFKELRELMVSKGLPAFSATQIYQWPYKKFNFNPSEWSNLSQKSRNTLIADFDFSLPQIVWQSASKDGTRKFLVRMSDNQTVEAVAIPAPNRLTLCLSSQVGCAIGCTFCHTATQGLKRHLKTEEVVGQFLVVSQWLRENVSPETKLTNIVYMGQGEPLHNFENMKKATEIFMEEQGLALGQRKITLSTSGLVPQIERLSDFPPVNLAISLHSARNHIRSELMPINKVYDIERLFTAIKTIPLKAYRRITYEYLLIDGLNDQEEDVLALSQLLNRKESKINLIPFNDFPGSRFKRPSQERIMWFMDALIKKGYTCTIRATKGSDILAACGQLKSHVEKLNLWNQGAVASESSSAL